MMSMSDFTVGGVLRQCLALLRRQWVLLLSAALLLVALPTILGSVTILRLPRPVSPAWNILPFGLSFVGGIVFQIVAYRALLGGADGSSSADARWVGPVLRLFFPVLAIDILAAVGGGLAAILLVFPAVILMCRWFLIFPIGIVENLGVFEPFRRSATLTKGFRWPIFGILLLSALIGFAVILPLSFAMGFLVSLAHLQWAGVAVVIKGVSTAVGQIPTLVAAAATYMELRRVKEGLLSPELVDAFA